MWILLDRRSAGLLPIVIWVAGLEKRRLIEAISTLQHLTAVGEPRDNGGMPMISRGFVHQVQLRQEVDQAKKAIAESIAKAFDTVDVQFTLETDSSGEPAIFFSILLTPYGSEESRLAEVTGRVATTLFDTIQPYNQWGLQSYFNFTSDPAHYGNPEWM